MISAVRGTVPRALGMPNDGSPTSLETPLGTETAPGDVTLLVPEEDVAEPELSIVIPALNEELTVGAFVDWCKEGLAKVGIAGEVLIVDSSSDATAEVALRHGARVLKTPKRGLGRAYIDALPFIRGRFVLMGDADCTYDFRELEPFVEKFLQGYEFVMGSRWRGSIEPGSMPFLHQYLGTPVTTRILNLLYGSRFSDIHCGMRGITRDALERMDLHSQSWEYASEMILKSVHMELRTAEVPVRFLKDPEGRLSHHKRAGWFSPWAAAWINLRAMFIYGSHFFVFKPGIVLMALGLLLTLPVSFGDVDLGPARALSQLAVPRRRPADCRLPGVRPRLHRADPLRLHRPAPTAMGTGVPVHPNGPDRVRSGSSGDRARDSARGDLRRRGPRASACGHRGQPPRGDRARCAVIVGAQLFVFTLLLHGTVVATDHVRRRHAVRDS